jgi:hypothetical protein
MRGPYVALAALLLAACGTQSSDPEAGAGDDPSTPVVTPTATPTEKPTEVPAAEGEVTTGGPVTVLDDGRGAEACLGGVLQSLPPQCGGPALVGWEWADHEGDFDERGDTRWGEFVITGIFDGQDITPTDVLPAKDWEPVETPDEEDPLGTPCPEPAGGWQPVDPGTTTNEALDQAIARANGLPGFSQVWVDQSINPASSEEPGGLEWELRLNDPKLLVLNVAVTEDVAGAEAAVREVWGGALCVSEAPYTDRELARIQDEMLDLPGMHASDHDLDGVNVWVTYDDGSLQAWVDQEYGPGVVEVSSALVRAGP